MIEFTEMEKALFWTKVKVTNYCWLWDGAITKNGYGLLTVRQKNHFAHRVAYSIFNGNIPEGLDICHKCDIRNCVNPKHLFIGTRSDNLRDMVAKGRFGKRNSPKGEKVWNAKLNENSVREIRLLYATGRYTQRQLAKQFDVSQKTINSLLQRKIWLHVD